MWNLLSWQVPTADDITIRVVSNAERSNLVRDSFHKRYVNSNEYQVGFLLSAFYVLTHLLGGASIQEQVCSYVSRPFKRGHIVVWHVCSRVRE